jgi:hypothetical protein
MWPKPAPPRASMRWCKSPHRRGSGQRIRLWPEQGRRRAGGAVGLPLGDDHAPILGLRA